MVDIEVNDQTLSTIAKVVGLSINHEMVDRFIPVYSQIEMLKQVDPQAAAETTASIMQSQRDYIHVRRFLSMLRDIDDQVIEKMDQLPVEYVEHPYILYFINTKVLFFNQ